MAHWRQHAEIAGAGGEAVQAAEALEQRSAQHVDLLPFGEVERHERGTLGFALVARLEVQVQKLLALAADRGATPTQREAIAREWIHLQALRVTAYRSLSALERTGIPGPEGSILKLQWSEANQRVTKLALELLGPDAQLLAPNAPYGGYWTTQQLRSRGNTIEAGTSEILRNIVAERVLGLPKSR